MPEWFERKGEQLILSLYVQPGAKRSEVSGLHGDALKIRLAAPALEGRANKALLDFIAELFERPASQIELKRGEKSRFKQVIVHGSKIDPSSLVLKP